MDDKMIKDMCVSNQGATTRLQYGTDCFDTARTRDDSDWVRVSHVLAWRAIRCGRAPVTRGKGLCELTEPLSMPRLTVRSFDSASFHQLLWEQTDFDRIQHSVQW